MATVVELPVVPPPLPVGWTAPAGSGKPISSLVERRLLPAGPAYLAHVRRAVHNLTFEQHDKHAEEERKRLEALNGNGLNGEDDLGVGEEKETEELLTLDPKEWKKQDHYAVLGLSHLRYKATDEQIKIAHRKKVLKHHPDKKAGVAGDSNDDAFFKCIQKAMEVLTNPERRRQFDSVDPYYELLEADVPTAAQVTKAKDPQSYFFRKFAPVFEREARFSKKQPVPMLGSYEASKEVVEGFYDFWYNFDSWRSFEYLDKEVNEGSDNRDDKRYTEKKNKSERARRKKEDTARLRGIVDVALGVDPRIKRIKQEEKDAREAKKKNKGGVTNGVKSKEQQEERRRRKRKRRSGKRGGKGALRARRQRRRRQPPPPPPKKHGDSSVWRKRLPHKLFVA
ncbi:Zuotin [Grifola frondosa]|uniref:Zuotin n=1 Tax=Grifola frondosa TaxID=5627 RepID=A0A1C7LU17_GRIFR|nr:Zuotin [Grifola frondosa]